MATEAANTTRSTGSATSAFGVERLTARQLDRLETGLEAGDPDYKVTVAWRCYQKLRSAYRPDNLADGRAVAVKIAESFHTCPTPEIADSTAPYGPGSGSSWPTSPPAARTTAAQRPSTGSSSSTAGSPADSAIPTTID